MKYIHFFAISLLIFLLSCGGNKETTTTDNTSNSTSHTENAGNDDKKEEKKSSENYDPKRGEGKFTDENLKLGSLDATLATKGKEVADVKCTSCHKLTDERLVGPGWKGVTERRKPAWIMNFITNPDPMIDKDPELQKQLEICLVRMPNQSLVEEEARALVEFMRQNDGVK